MDMATQDSYSTTDTLAVNCRNVGKIYGKGENQVVALRGVDLQVERGELMMLVGPSGCGKTTLISVIAGILDRDSGECEIFDHDFSKMSQRERTAWRGKTVGFVFQQFNLLPTLTVAENVSVPLLINGVPRREAVARAKKTLATVGLGERTHSYPRELSGGQQQRVAIARALVHEPKLIVCDEPTSALDHDTGHRVMELLKDVAVDAGRALIVVTHDSRIFEFADRIAHMDDGRVIDVQKKMEPRMHADERG